MKICLVSTQLGIGGAENQVAALADAFASRGHGVTIISLLNIVKIKTNPDVNIFTLNIDKRQPLTLIKGAIKYIQLIKNIKPDVVHSHSIHANILARVTNIFLKHENVICTAHSRNEGGRWAMLLYRITNRFARKLTIVSQDAAENFIALGAVKRNNVQVVYNGIDMHRFQPRSSLRDLREDFNITDSRLVCLSVGRLTDAKDYPNLIHAAKKAVHQVDCCFFIAGDGELREEIEDLIKTEEMQSHMYMLGSRSDINDLLQSSDLFILSSKWEGLPLALAEAMAAGKPTISTDCGGPREILSSEFLVEPQNSTALSQKIVDFSKLPPEDRRIVGEINRQAIRQKMDLEKISDTWLEIYSETKKWLK